MLTKKVFDEETAQYLGYQKEYPTLLGWVAVTIACLLFGFIFVGGLAILIMVFV